MPTIKRFKISDTDPLAIIDLGWSMEFLEDDMGNFAIAPPHVICRADTPAEAARTVDLLNAVAPLADTLKQVESLASWALADLYLSINPNFGILDRALIKIAHWTRTCLDTNHRRAKTRLTQAEDRAAATLGELQAVIRGAK